MSQSGIETKREVRNLVTRYERKPDPIEHERLLPLIKEYFGEDAAEFFDIEGCLPLSSSRGIGRPPWPMRAGEILNYESWVFLSSVSAVLLTIGVLAKMDVVFILSLAITIVVGMAVVSGIPTVHRLFPPADLSERKRLLGVFNEIVERNQSIAAAQPASARAARITSYATW